MDPGRMTTNLLSSPETRYIWCSMKYLLALCVVIAFSACSNTEYSNSRQMQKKDAAAEAAATQGINQM